MRSILRRILIVSAAVLAFCSGARSFAGSLIGSSCADSPCSVPGVRRIAASASGEAAKSVSAIDADAAFDSLRLPSFVVNELLVGNRSLDLQHLATNSIPSEVMTDSETIAPVRANAVARTNSRNVGKVPVRAAEAGAELFPRLEASARTEPRPRDYDFADGLGGGIGARHGTPEPSAPSGGGGASGMGAGASALNRDQVIGLLASSPIADREMQFRKNSSDIPLRPIRQSIQIFRPPRMTA
jgi:hypothetical protein